jgi:phage FluMu protein Com
MQIRCYSCNMPFALNRDAIYDALDHIEAENLHHYNFPCPRCRKVNRISRQQLLKAAPGWTAGGQEGSEGEATTETETETEAEVDQETK